MIILVPMLASLSALCFHYDKFFFFCTDSQTVESKSVNNRKRTATEPLTDISSVSKTCICSLHPQVI